MSAGLTIAGVNGGASSWTPTIATVDIGYSQAFNQPVGTTQATGVGIWGAAPYAWKRDDGALVDFGFRMVMGADIDAAFDTGDGFLAITLPADPYNAASRIGSGWVFAMDQSYGTVKRSVQFILDPPYSTTKPIIAPDGTTTFSSFDPSNSPPPAYFVAPTGAPTTVDARLFVIAGSGRYRKA